MADQTIVYQSYRTADVPPWLETCLRSAREWAAARGFEYRYFDDRFFEFCPPWYRDAVRRNVLLQSDLARLVAARELLAEGCGRAIWIDADVLVFAPDRFDVETGHPFAFNTELWVGPDAQNRIVGWRRVNNAVCTFARGNAILDFYIDACQRIVRHKPDDALDRLGVGTQFLSTLNQLVPLPLIRCVGTFNPILMDHLARGDAAHLRAYRQGFGQPVAAANLCGSFRHAVCQGVKMEDSIYDGVVRRLLAGEGKEIAR